MQDTVRSFYCPGHVKRLCDGVDRRGMGHLVWSDSGKKDDRGEAWNPLDVADVMVIFALTKDRDSMPQHLRLPRTLGCVAVVPQEGCPLCEVDRHLGAGFGDQWADTILDHCLVYARAKRLVDRPKHKVQFSLVA